MTDPESAPELTTEQPEKEPVTEEDEGEETSGDVDKTSELLAVVDEQESKDQGATQYFSTAELPDAEGEEQEEEDDGDEVAADDARITSEAEFFEGIEAPPGTANDEKYDDTSAPEAMQATTEAIESAKIAAQKKKMKEEAEVPPDFSQYQTNVAQRLWNAQQVAEKSGVSQSGELIRLLKEYQAYRVKIRKMIKAADDYQAALKNVTACRGKVGSKEWMSTSKCISMARRLQFPDSIFFLFLFVADRLIRSFSVHTLRSPKAHLSGILLANH